MNKKSIEGSTRKIVNEIVHNTDIELVDIEYVKEGPFKYLRIFIDKPGGITVDDTADISRALNKKLDEIDLIKEQYFLEVSSPGVERPFKTDADYQKNIGETVEAKLFKPLDGKKAIKGKLIEKNEDGVVIQDGEEIIAIEIKDISKINKVIEDF
ncbi:MULTISPECIES: ribosome maturation factor RimP [Sedimentibacter]|uniref:Ribosome maturation factor RimP n=1 Tax=Sedimentibacter hydroxybenzoicus DSM 7310 TaxID=1123245 RepID=A0A974GWK9_SEDHY|nr:MULTISPECIES: ribosome maturation factor RimP [Sedimentibacter]NYB74376.1 ribosome maturation factor RimP [Sedimentibacter hydroxybenzoicus DSM 7310]